MIASNFRYLNIDSLGVLYTALVQPHMEFAISSWCPYLEKEIVELEKVQRRATNIIPLVRNYEYDKIL